MGILFLYKNKERPKIRELNTGGRRQSDNSEPDYD
jgi:hypothetical protein